MCISNRFPGGTGIVDLGLLIRAQESGLLRSFMSGMEFFRDQQAFSQSGVMLPSSEKDIGGWVF